MEKIFLRIYICFIARNCGIYMKFTTPRKQQTKAGLQKGTETLNSSFKGRLANALMSTDLDK
jgi:hypothetical protein